MKKKNNHVPAISKLNRRRQICNFIPEFLVHNISGVPLQLESQLQPALYDAAGVAMEEVGCFEFAAPLWDTRYQTMSLRRSL
jgi:hypothetical protein